MKTPVFAALIPARSGSKSIPHKNLYPYKGKPLMAHSIEQALGASLVERVFVSTDSEEYARVAREYGAETPFLRPPEISGDEATDIEAFIHFIERLEASGQRVPDAWVHLRPTYPARPEGLIDRTIEHFIRFWDEADSLRTVVPTPATPYKMWRTEGNFLKPFVHLEGVDEPYNQPRQKLPEVYWQNACIDIVKTVTILKKKTMTGDPILCFEMDRDQIHDIDELHELQRLERQG